MHFENREEVIKFQERLESYVRSRNQKPIWHYDLEIAYDICRIRWSARIFSALVDLRINSMLVSCDLAEIHRLWRKIDQNVSNPQQYPDDDSTFAVRMQIHHLLSGIALRYRALWDKLFEFLLMLPFQSPRSNDENKKIIQEAGITKGKKNLRKLLRKTPMNPNTIVQIFHYLQRFDSLYRTPEAHSVGGAMSKWTLSAQKMDDTPFPEFLLDAWNLWNIEEVRLGNMFGEKALSVLQADQDRAKDKAVVNEGKK